MFLFIIIIFITLAFSIFLQDKLKEINNEFKQIIKVEHVENITLPNIGFYDILITTSLVFILSIINYFLLDQFLLETYLVIELFSLLLLYLSVLDYYYRIIDISYCQFIIYLFFLGIYLEVLVFDIREIITSLSFAICSLLIPYWLIKIIFKIEILGYGDCLFFNSISIFYNWYELLWLLFISSILGIVYYMVVLLFKRNIKFNYKIPYIICLSLAGLVIFYKKFYFY